MKKFLKRVESFLDRYMWGEKTKQLPKEMLVAALTGALEKSFNERQEREFQYVVAYYKTKDDSILGYHASTFCELTQDIIQAKRYSGYNPYPQLQTISKNLKYTLDEEHDERNMFKAAFDHIKKNNFHNLKSSEVYMDAIYLDTDIPKQKFKFKIL